MTGERPNQTHPAVADAEGRRWRALELRKRGKSYRDIANELTCSLSTAHGYVSEALAELRAQVLESAQELREIELQKLDELEDEMRKRLPGADDQDAAKLTSVVVKIQESRRKLLGLDAPQQVEVTGNLYTVREASPACPEWEKPRP